MYQEVNLLGNLTVAENVLLGREPRRFGGINWRAMRRRAAEILEGLSLDVDPNSLLNSHSLAVQQLVAIARAIDIKAKVLILDEPTSSLDLEEVAELFRVIRSLKESGVAILFVSHFLDQVYEISDRLTVLRNGQLVGEYLTPELLRIDLVQAMIGKELATLDDLESRVHSGERDVAPEEGVEPFLVASGITRKGAIAPVDLVIGAGEVVGLAGLLGSGRTEVARLIGGVDRTDAGPARRSTARPSSCGRRGRPSSTASPTPRRTVARRASSTSSACATT